MPIALTSVSDLFKGQFECPETIGIVRNEQICIENKLRKELILNKITSR